MTIQNKNIIKISDECSDASEEQIEWLLERVSKTKEKPKSSRCKDTIDWVEEEYSDAYKKPYEYKKPKKGSQSCKQSISSTLVKQLTKCEIESLRQNKRDAYELMMKMNLKLHTLIVEDAVFELNNQGVDSDIIALIEDV